MDGRGVVNRFRSCRRWFCPTPCEAELINNVLVGAYKHIIVFLIVRVKEKHYFFICIFIGYPVVPRPGSRPAFYIGFPFNINRILQKVYSKAKCSEVSIEREGNHK